MVKILSLVHQTESKQQPNIGQDPVSQPTATIKSMVPEMVNDKSVTVSSFISDISFPLLIFIAEFQLCLR